MVTKNETQRERCDSKCNVSTASVIDAIGFPVLLVAPLVSPTREARYAGLGLKCPIHAAKRGRFAPPASLRSDTENKEMVFRI
jgi:hypothetical protein